MGNTVRAPVCCLLALVVPLSAAAGDDSAPAGTSATPQDIRIVGERPLGTSTASVVTLAPGEAAGMSVADALRDVPGLALRRSGTLGNYSALSLRGLGPQNISIVLDDVELSSATFSPFDLGTLPAAGIDRIEVFRGSGPLGASSPLGGVVRLATKPPDKGETPRAAANIGFGSFMSRSADAALSARAGDLAYSVLAGYQGTRGDFPYFADGGLLYSDTAGVMLRRQNNHYDGLRLRAALEAPGPEGSAWRASLNGVGHAQGVAGPADSPTEVARANDGEIFGRVALAEVALADGTLLASLGADGLGARRAFLDPLRETGLRIGDQRSTLWRGGADARVVWQPTTSVEFELLPRLAYDAYAQDRLQTSLADEEGVTRSRLQSTAGIEVRADILADLRLVASLRDELLHDRGSALATTTTFGAPSPRVGALWTVSPCELRANAGRFYRSPTLLERYGDGVMSGPSLDLLPEKGLAADLGGRCALRDLPFATALRFELTGFANDAENLIVVVPNSQRYLRATNIGHTRSFGTELGAELSHAYAELELAYTFTASRDASLVLGHGGKQTPGVSPHRLELSLDVGPRTASLGGGVSYTSQSYLDPFNSRPIAARLLLDAHARHALGHGFEARVRVSNLANVTHEQVTIVNRPDPLRVAAMDFLGYPLPGRSWALTLGWSTP